AQGPGRGKGTSAGVEAKGSDSEAALSGGDSGGDWWENYCARERFGLAKKRDREMLRRRHHPETQTAGETERRKKTNEEHWEDQHSAGGIYRSAQSAMKNVNRESRSVNRTGSLCPQLALPM